MSTLFETKQEHRAEIQLPDFYVLYLQKLGKVAAGWRLVQWSTSDSDCPEGFVRIMGAVMPPGKIKWAKRDKATESVHFIYLAELESFRSELAEAQGVCRECWNHKEVWCGWSVDRGHKYKPCPTCAARDSEGASR